jgi:hypothetical protein
VPGGAAGLQNWQARLKKVNANEALAITHRFSFFISSFQIFSHFADIDLLRLILVKIGNRVVTWKQLVMNC